MRSQAAKAATDGPGATVQAESMLAVIFAAFKGARCDLLA